MKGLDSLVRHILKWECGATASQICQFPELVDLFDAVKTTKCCSRDSGGRHADIGRMAVNWKIPGQDDGGRRNPELADFFSMTYGQWYGIIKHGYWDRAQADGINNQSVANMIVDFMITSSGAPYVVQRTVGTRADGIIGPRTVSAINAQPSDVLFSRLASARLRYYRHQPLWGCCGKEWMLRVRDIRFVR